LIEAVTAWQRLDERSLDLSAIETAEEHGLLTFHALPGMEDAEAAVGARAYVAGEATLTRAEAENNRGAEVLIPITAAGIATDLSHIKFAVSLRPDRRAMVIGNCISGTDSFHAFTASEVAAGRAEAEADVVEALVSDPAPTLERWDATIRRSTSD
jgi:hypothetical protein